jgi:hypothetical protein
MAMTEAQKRAAKKYNAKPAQIKRRSSRNKARRKMIKAGKARKGDGKDVGHANGNPLKNGYGNLKMQTKKSNRSFPRKKNGSKKNPRD